MAFCMQEIKTVAVIGLGALGTLFGNHLSKRMGKYDLRIIADRNRIARYQREKVYINGAECGFHYATPDEKTGPAGIVLIAVKYLQLNDAIQDIQNQVGPNTLILSLLNGITSEKIIAEAYGMDKVVYCVAQGMDAVKEGNLLTYKNMGKLCIGPPDGGPMPDKVQRVESFFQRMELPYEVDEHMQKRMWGKFMLNVGVNQTVAVFGPCYVDIQQNGPQRDTMIAAMREVIALSELEGVFLTQEDLQYWLRVLGTLNPAGKPSMRQDVEAKRPSEVALFAGTVLQLAKKHGFTAPVNQMLYDNILAIEAQY
jgi:2-dehydropantoate 2-reductase